MLDVGLVVERSVGRDQVVDALNLDAVSGEEQQAEIVIGIFRRYLELGSARQLATELERDGVRSKSWVTRAGKAIGGAVIGRGGVIHILQNRVYRGEIVHRDRVYPGLHKPIIDAELFAAVQAKLADQAVVRSDRPVRAISGPLAGKLYDADGHAMSPSFSYGRGGRVYRYYVPLACQTGVDRERGEGVFRRVSATAVEAFILAQIQRLTGRVDLTLADLKDVVRRIELRSDDTHLVISGCDAFPGDHVDLTLASVRRRLGEDEHAVQDGDGDIRIVFGHRLQLRGGRAYIRGGEQQSKKQINPALVRALRRGHQDLLALKASPLTSPAEQIDAVVPETQHDRQIARLALMSPDLQRQILEGRQPSTLSLRQLLKSPLPLAWADQSTLLEDLARSGANRL